MASAFASARAESGEGVAEYQVPRVYLEDAQHKKHDMSRYFDKHYVHVVSFVFVDCKVSCPITVGVIKNLMKTLDAYGPKVRVTLITIDPDRDSSSRLASHFGADGASERFTFLSGSYDDIVQMQRAFRVYRGDKMNHPNVILVSYPDSSGWSRFEGLTSSESIAVEMRQHLDH